MQRRWIDITISVECICFPLTREVVELMQCLHDDGDERQVELGNMGFNLRVSITRVCVMAAQQGVDSTNGLFMKEENPAGDRKSISAYFIWFSELYARGAQYFLT